MQPYLTDLVLAGNPLGRRGARHISLLVQRAASLIAVDVGGCAIRNSGMTYLVFATCKRSILMRRIDARNNELDMLLCRRLSYKVME